MSENDKFKLKKKKKMIYYPTYYKYYYYYHLIFINVISFLPSITVCWDVGGGGSWYGF